VNQGNEFFRVLCVDDNLDFQRPLKMGLRSYGLDVITASHGLDGLTQYRAHDGHFGAIVSDHDMPQMNGLEFIRSLREMGYSGRIALMSGRLKAEDLYAYQSYRICGFFSKPFDIGMLVELLLQHPN
jgi:CheY-like chemotaxis protein